MTDEEYQAVDRVQRWRDSGGWKLSVVYLCGYNPNLLLTDQRSELAKFAALHRPLGETYQPILADSPYHRGGVFKPARRMGKTAAMERIPHLFPGEEIVMLPAGEHVMPHKQHEQIQARLRRAMTVPVFTAEVDRTTEAMVRFSAQTEQFTARMKQFSEQIARMNEKVYLRMIFGTQPKSEPGDMFHHEYRLARLLFSADPRQRKRGKRLFEKWRMTRSGINLSGWTRDEKRELYRRGYGRGHYRKD